MLFLSGSFEMVLEQCLCVVSASHIFAYILLWVIACNEHLLKLDNTHGSLMSFHIFEPLSGFRYQYYLFCL